MQTANWDTTFHEIYEHAMTSYRAGNRRAANFISKADADFLATIGCTNQELFDFIEDGSNEDDPAFETVLLVTSTRRDYFHLVQADERSQHTVAMANLPAKSAQLDGIAWLPRLIAKARAKLRGEMPAELMYGCGGDRQFLRNVDIHPADFLRFVWSVDGDEQKILAFVRRSAGR